MESALAFQQSLAHLLRARFPILALSTPEEARATALIEGVAADQSVIKTTRRVFVWTCTRGFIENGKPIGKGSDSPLAACDFIEQFQDAAIFILKDFHAYLGGGGRPVDPQIVRRLRDLVPLLKLGAAPRNVVLLSPILALPPELEKDVTVVDFPLASLSELRAVLAEIIDANRTTGKVAVDVNEEDLERLAKAAQGLTLHEAENAFARAMVQDGKLSADDVATVLEEKRQTIRKSGILEFVKSDLNIADVGGLQNLKRWLVKRNKSWLDSAARYNLPAPRGVLLTGVPGCGKSLMAKSVSAMWHLPLLRMDVGRLFAGLVGASEENMRKAIDTAEAIAPCVLWIDEIEKGFSGSTGPSGDSGTSARVFGSFLTWMQEKTKPVFVVATANNISALPPEMLRKGRFDEIFFVDLPTRSEREEILKLHLAKRLTHPDVIGDFRIDQTTVSKLAEASEGFVGAELEQLVVSGTFEAFHEDRAVTYDDFARAIDFTVPLSVTQAEQIQRLREWANVRAVAATPREDRASYAEPAKPAAPPNAPEDVTGQRGGRSIDF